MAELCCRFKPLVAKEIIRAVLNERLAGKTYSTDDSAKWTKEIATAIKLKLKGACCVSPLAGRLG